MWLHGQEGGQKTVRTHRRISSMLLFTTSIMEPSYSSTEYEYAMSNSYNITINTRYYYSLFDIVVSLPLLLRLASRRSIHYHTHLVLGLGPRQAQLPWQPLVHRPPVEPYYYVGSHSLQYRVFQVGKAVCGIAEECPILCS